MNKTVLVSAGILAVIDAFLKSTAVNVIIFIVVGIAALYFGFKLFGKTKIGGTIAMLMGILFILFAFIKDIVKFNGAHIAVSIILGLILIASPFIGKLVKE
jgi:predicted negative regulator of RcsB-dependent stress response